MCSGLRHYPIRRQMPLFQLWGLARSWYLRQQAGKIGLDRRIALAGRSFESCPIRDVDRATMSVADESGFLQSASDDRHRRTANAEHDGQELVRQLQLVAAHPIRRHQQPPATPLLGGMQYVAGARLLDLKRQSLIVSNHLIEECSVQSHLSHKRCDGHPED